MSDQTPAKVRPIAGTENSCCKAASGGTGINVVSLLLNKPPDSSILQNALHKLQYYQPILRSTLCFDSLSSSFSLLIPPSPSPSLLLHSFDHLSTAEIIQSYQPQVGVGPTITITPFQILVEHELNSNPWENLDRPSSSSESSSSAVDVMHVSLYEIEEAKQWAVMMKVHTGACDRTAAVYVMQEFMSLMTSKNHDNDVSSGSGAQVCLGVEEYIPSGKTNKPFWARGADLLGYSLNAFRLNNLEFADPDSTIRSSRVVRLLLDSDHTTKLLEGCKVRGIKLCGALSAAALIAARLSKSLPDGEWEKYAVVTLIDCRILLEPALSSHHVGFYHSGILNSHDMKGGEEHWELAKRTYTSFEDAKNSNKHFSDMADLNFLMCRAIENPGLTPSSSLRTSFISVFEDPVIDETNENHEELGVEDYMGCASTHGVGPSIAIFDTVRHGKLDCACVYPYPLHSREQMQGLIENMKRIIIDSL